MELFDKVYSCYYRVVLQILKEAGSKGLTRKEIEQLCRQYGYQESALTIVPALTGDSWPLLKRQEDGTFISRLSGEENFPLTGLQKSWLKALLDDVRIRLFLTQEELEEAQTALTGVAPLYREEAFHYFDRFRDGDPYESEEYRTHFRSILEAVRDGKILFLAYEGKGGKIRTFEAVPCGLQYSPKDDKFRLNCLERYRGRFSRGIYLNLSKVRGCHVTEHTFDWQGEVYGDARGYERCKVRCEERLGVRGRSPFPGNARKTAEPVLLRISGERNSLERCMLHFANYEKHTVFDEEQDCWFSSISYDPADETELLIDVLAFGPVIEVLGPEGFLRQVRERVRMQHVRLYQTMYPAYMEEPAGGSECMKGGAAP